MNKVKTFSAIQITCIPILILSCLLYGCGLDTSEDDSRYETEDGYYYPKTQNIIFYNTEEVPLEISENVADPSFAWRATGLRYFVITIFNSKIDLKENQIANTEDAVWTWNTGMGKGREGNVSFSDGRDVIGGEIQSTVAPLPAGTYYIAAWGYDDRYNLIYSSKEYLYVYTP
jgi:hypothetical protein